MPRRYLIHAGIVSCWLLVVGAGQLWLLGYEAGPGAEAPPGDWPAGSTLRPGDGRMTLVFFAHPRCPCTRAGLEDLSWAMARSRGAVDAFAVFVLPPGSPGGWGRSPLWEAAASIPGVRPVLDAAGVEASRFRAATSGQTFLFDSGGALLFSGGITGGRGHAGDNPARSALVRCFSERVPGRRDFPVFGCALLGAERAERESNEEGKP